MRWVDFNQKLPTQEKSYGNILENF